MRACQAAEALAAEAMAAEARRALAAEHASEEAVAMRSVELRASIQDAIATTMAYLKGKLIQLRPVDKVGLGLG